MKFASPWKQSIHFEGSYCRQSQIVSRACMLGSHCGHKNRLCCFDHCRVPLRRHLPVTNLVRMNAITEVIAFKACMLINDPDRRLRSAQCCGPQRDSRVEVEDNALQSANMYWQYLRHLIVENQFLRKRVLGSVAYNNLHVAVVISHLLHKSCESIQDRARSIPVADIIRP